MKSYINSYLSVKLLWFLIKSGIDSFEIADHPFLARRLCKVPVFVIFTYKFLKYYRFTSDGKCRNVAGVKKKKIGGKSF